MTAAALSDVDVTPYEGLIQTTSRKFAKLAGFDEEDMCQELRLKAAKALVSYNPTRTKMTVDAFVFGCIWNRRVDLCRTHLRKLNHGVTVGHIEDYVRKSGNGEHSSDRFDGRYFHVDREEVYERIEEGLLVLPAKLTDLELKVLLLLTLDMSRTEIAVRLSISRSESFATVEHLQELFRDWKPDSPSNESATVALDEIDIPVAA